MSIIVFYRCYHFWWAWLGMPKVLKITSMQYLPRFSRKNWVMKLMFRMLINWYMSFTSWYCYFHGFDQSCPKYLGKFGMSLWYPKKEVRNEVRVMTALAGSTTTLTIYNTSNFLPTLNIFLSQYGIYTKSFLHLINCLCRISPLLLFQVMLAPCNLLCL